MTRTGRSGDGDLSPGDADASRCLGGRPETRPRICWPASTSAPRARNERPKLLAAGPARGAGGARLFLRRRGPARSRAGDSIRQTLGHGTLALSRAWQSDLQREVALKLLHQVAPDAAGRLVAEARTLARIRHENVVTIFTRTTSTAKSAWMELVRGGP